MRDKQKGGGALSKVQRLKKRLSQSFGKLGKKTVRERCGCTMMIVGRELMFIS